MDDLKILEELSRLSYGEMVDMGYSFARQCSSDEARAIALAVVDIRLAKEQVEDSVTVRMAQAVIDWGKTKPA